ncbi:uncharacterized protein SCHCODRAFT_02638034 [Schizophyllum commune H4-8]|uniref:uncharacterized protein n=1 Tax=Schizophyllum commune (strain H4-8 / FGSC 9210) TaxID=578458 RepID=UPI00215ED555|nr:uncharacterized protein SCHCODRAFT_02638034 [Schizophyllum commune H4-8]KAI5887409.1 hypothetical protein SCHCODRAFT_02638034 [Schizophyllum commune H4-8]
MPGPAPSASTISHLQSGKLVASSALFALVAQLARSAPLALISRSRLDDAYKTSCRLAFPPRPSSPRRAYHPYFSSAIDVALNSSSILSSGHLSLSTS